MAYSPKTVKEVDAHAFIKAYAGYLKQQGKVKVPAWADHVKTATHRELAPYDADWYFVRVAAIARRLYLRQASDLLAANSFIALAAVCREVVDDGVQKRVDEVNASSSVPCEGEGPRTLLSPVLL